MLFYVYSFFMYLFFSLLLSANDIQASEGLEILPFHQFQKIYDDSDSGANQNVSIWRPDMKKAPSGFYAIGDQSVARHEGAPQTAFLVKGENNVLRTPVAYQKIWTDRGSGGKHDVSIFRPVAPSGFICLGDVAHPSYSGEPSLDAIRCIRQDLLVRGQASAIWNSKGSGSKEKVSLWVARSDELVGGLRPNVMIAVPRYEFPSPPERVPYLLRFDRLLNLDTSFIPQRTAINSAPDIYFHPKEEFFPASVEFHLANTVEKNGYLIAQISCDICTDLPFLHGQDPTKESVPLYAITILKNDSRFFDIIYFTFYPYNLGKYVDPILWDKTWYGNHVGDWEHMSVRYFKGYPLSLHLGQHDNGESFDWGDHDLYWQMRVVDSEKMLMSMFPVLLSAKGSHGLYPRAGSHVYREISLAGLKTIKLIDETAFGKLWQGSQNVRVIDYRVPNIDIYQDDLAWMNFRGRWGNPEQSCISTIGVCRLEDGPKGPIEKSYVTAELKPLD